MVLGAVNCARVNSLVEMGAGIIFSLVQIIPAPSFVPIFEVRN